MLTEQERLAASWAVVALLFVMVTTLWLGILGNRSPIVTESRTVTTEEPPP